MTGLFLAFVLGLAQRLFAFSRFGLSIIFESMRPVPSVALVPFFILWFGYAWYGKWILISIGVFLLMYPAIINSVDQLNPIYYRLARTLGATDSEFLLHSALPAMIPGLLGQLRVGISFSLALAVVSEYMGANLGLGKILNISLNTFSTHTIVLCIIILGVIGYFLDLILRLLHRYAVSWSVTVDEAIQ
jgi:ABC-type nitrate/sulfonate/bicarbonate transport system permease component